MPTTIIPNLDSLKAGVGREVGVSDWLVVTQDMIDAFAQLTGDRQWIHVDPARAAAESPYGATVAHGFLTLGLISRLHASSVLLQGDFARVINYGLGKVRFPAPVPAGAAIRTRSVLQGLEEVGEAVQLSWIVTVEVEGQGKPALFAEWIVRLYRE